MPRVTFEETLPYKVADIYDIVMDVERYPQIFPFIQAVKAQKTGDNAMAADVTVRTPVMDFSYSCDIVSDPPQAIDIKATKGPFKAMNARWGFESLPNGHTKISYEMNYDSGFGLLNSMAKGFIESQVEQTRTHIMAYLADTLDPVTAPASAPPRPPQVR